MIDIAPAARVTYFWETDLEIRSAYAFVSYLCVLPYRCLELAKAVHVHESEEIPRTNISVLTVHLSPCAICSTMFSFAFFLSTLLLYMYHVFVFRSGFVPISLKAMRYSLFMSLIGLDALLMHCLDRVVWLC